MRSLDRVIIPEILDSLAPTDTRAIRSRRDLKWIDLYLGNSRWILKRLAAQRPSSILEIGAGNGDLCQAIHSELPSSSITGCDLIARPPQLPQGIHWISGDFFQTLPMLKADTCLGSLILHHFPLDALRDLGTHLKAFHRLFFCEPLRSRVPLVLSNLSSIFMGEVTRHDMPTSIRAGFRVGEIGPLLGLDSAKWSIQESEQWRGVLRWSATRR